MVAAHCVVRCRRHPLLRRVQVVTATLKPGPSTSLARQFVLEKQTFAKTGSVQNIGRNLKRRGSFRRPNQVSCFLCRRRRRTR
jgi:hypothetical protein